MLFGMVLAFSTNNSVFRLCLVLSIHFSWLPLSSLFQSDVGLVNLADHLIQLSSYLFHPWHIWSPFISFPDTYPKLDKLFHFWHLSFLRSSPSSVLKNRFWSRWNMILSCFLLRFSSHFSSFIFLYLSLSNYFSLASLRF